MRTRVGKVGAVGSLLALSACVDTSGWPRYAFNLPMTEQDVLVMCQPGQSPEVTQARAEASAAAFDSAIASAADELVAPIQREVDGGPDASNLDIFRSAWRSNGIMQRTTDRVADEYACFLTE